VESSFYPTHYGATTNRKSRHRTDRPAKTPKKPSRTRARQTIHFDSLKTPWSGTSFDPTKDFRMRNIDAIKLPNVPVSESIRNALKFLQKRSVAR
jgi:hypothetical protein